MASPSRTWATSFTLGALVVACLWCAVLAEEIYTHEFAVHIRGDRSAADRLAKKYGYTNHGQIGALDDHYLFSHERVSKRSLTASTGQHTNIADEPEVEWFEQQVSRTRVKRDRNHIEKVVSPLLSAPLFSDPLWPKQWYLDGNWTTTDWARPSVSMNVQQAWAQGYTGAGVVVTIMDDGLEYNHTDIAASYDPKASYDYVSHDADPKPRYMSQKRREVNMHGTRCAGEIVMQPDNDKCGVGIAYNAKIGGIRMLDGGVTDQMEAASLGTWQQHIDIYSASWGPDDGGYTLEGPASLAESAMEQGVREGRGGKGSIYVWASGNGGMDEDDCNADGYANSMFTLVVSSATENQGKPFYSEHCSAALATTFSSGSHREKKVVTTDLHDECVDDFTGTSASAPMAAGICALALEANGNLTWRDMQYLVVVTSKRHQLSGDWATNGAGYDVSHWFGFGLMDAGAMVERARTWETLPEQLTCNNMLDIDSDRRSNSLWYSLFSSRRANDFTASFDVDGCGSKVTGQEPIRHLEHVQLTLTLNAKRRGNVVVRLTSPSGTTSTLLSRRPKDFRRTVNRWTLMTVHFWGENPVGTWNLTIGDGTNNRLTVRMGRLTLRGTAHLPESLRPTQVVTSQSVADGGAEDTMEEEEEEEVPSVSYEGRPREVRAIDSSSWDSSWWWSSSDWESFEVCHEECLYGCNGPSASDCIKCRHYKDRLTMDCVSTCPAGQFTPRELHIRCGRCNTNCKTCSGPKPEDCLSCPGGLFLTEENKCASGCGLGFYPDPFFKMCRQCALFCASCEGTENNCKACVHGAVLRGNQCVPRCMDSEYMEGDQCRPCDVSCFSCNGPDANHCTSCFDDYVHKDMTCVPIRDCGKGYYVANSFDASSRQCLRCHSTCVDCQGPYFTDCVECRTGSFLVGGACVQTCQDGKYLSEETGSCQPCSFGCALCTSKDTCLQCEPSKVLTSSMECMEGCHNGTYSMEGACLRCHSSCETCSGGGIMDCTKCRQPGGDTKYLLEGACVSYCPLGFFHSDQAEACEECDETCKTCIGHGADRCLTCEDGLGVPLDGRCREPADFDCNVQGCANCAFGSNSICEKCLEGQLLHGGSCSNECPSGTVGGASGVCELCHPSCRECSGEAYFCTSCDSDYYLVAEEGVCRSDCPYDTYVSADNKCLACHTVCASCNGEGEDSCTSCYDLNKFLSGSSCLTRCPDGQFGDEYTGTCRSCHPSCNTCSGPGDHECDTCHENFQQEQGFCRSTCRENSYKDPQGACQPCDSSCQTCTGSGKRACLSCNYYNFLDADRQCGADCPQFFYPDYESNVCRPCHKSCKTCLDSGAEDCIECADGTYMLLMNGQLCVETCPMGFYESTELGFWDCRQCSVECRDCSGTYLNCISCHDGTYLYQGRCYSTCPSGYDEDPRSNHCIQRENLCPLHCEDCDDWGDCTRCEENYREYFGECVGQGDMPCLSNEFVSDVSGNGTIICNPCHSTCATCLGPMATDCVRCKDDMIFQESICVDDCPDGTYKDTIFNECFECHPTCKTCDKGSQKDCMSCEERMHLTKDGHGECRSNCPRGQFAEGDNCEDCFGDNCASCSGSSQADCLTCELPFFKTDTGACVRQCPNTTYEYLLEDATEGNECRPCHVICHSCVGPGPSECTSCANGMLHLGGQCLWDCEEGYYPDTKGRCQRCHADCQTCNGPLDRSCMSCRIGQKLQDNMCVDECNTDYYTVQDGFPRCEPCDDSCLMCSDFGPFDCTSCYPNYQLDNGVCINRCGNNHFFDKEHQTCRQCASTCRECFGAAEDQCISCHGTLKLEKLDRNNSQCIPCCVDAPEGSECCESCKPDNTKCSNQLVHPAAPAGSLKQEHVGTIVFSIMLVVVLFFIVFGLLQARSHGKLCWGRKYSKVPSYSYNNKDKYVTLGKPDDDYYEEDIYGDVSDDEEEDIEETDTFQTVGAGFHHDAAKNGVIDHL